MIIIPSTASEWTRQSIEYANQKCYLDDLYKVYPVTHDSIRDIDMSVMRRVHHYFDEQDNVKLITELLKLKLFPIKDSYVPYLRRDPSAILRNPKTINRICGNLYQMGYDEIEKRCSEPKEGNRQIGPMFRNWVNAGNIGGLKPVDEYTFRHSTGDAILDGSDATFMAFAKKYLGYTRDKGLDFIGRFNGKYVVGEAKFISDQGGHQNDQLLDAITTIKSPMNEGVIKIGIIDGVTYIPPKSSRSLANNLYTNITKENLNIMSALLLNNFLYSL